MSDDDTKKRPTEEEIIRTLRDNEEGYFATRSAEDREVYLKAMNLGTEIVGEWEELYPALAIPMTAARTLEEMIWREVWRTFTPDQADPPLGAYDLAHDRLYINNAIRAGLRHGEPLQKEPEPLDEEAIGAPLIRGLPTGGTKH